MTLADVASDNKTIFDGDTIAFVQHVMEQYGMADGEVRQLRELLDP